MGHHGNHHHQGHDYKEEQQYGAHPGSNFGSSEASTSYAPPPVPSYGYQEQPLEFGDYGPVPSVPYGAIQPYGGYGYLQPSYGGAIQPYAQEGQMEHYRADEQRHRTNEHKGKAGAFGAAALAACEHRMEEQMAKITAVGAGCYALHENQQAQHELEENYGGAIQPYAQEGQMEHYRADEQRHRTNEHKEVGAFGAVAFADCEQWMEETLAELNAVGAGPYALYEHQQARHEPEKNWSDSRVEKERLAEINMAESEVNTRKERRNVKLSTDPNTVAARNRRNNIRNRDQILRILVPDCMDESKVPIPLLYDRTRSFVLSLQARLDRDEI